MATYTFTTGDKFFIIDNGQSRQRVAGSNLALTNFNREPQKLHLNQRSQVLLGQGKIVSEITIDLTVDTVDVDGQTSFADAEALAQVLSSLFFLDEGGGENPSTDSPIVVQPTPPSNTSKKWYNTADNLIYFYDGSDWLSSQLFSTVFNDQGGTPNNTFFRTGNTIGTDNGVGISIMFDIQLVELHYNRQPTTAATGQWWLYSNTATGSNTAVVTETFVVNSTSARGRIPSTTLANISASSYLSVRWNGTQTNNNVVNLFYRKRI